VTALRARPSLRSARTGLDHGAVAAGSFDAITSWTRPHGQHHDTDKLPSNPPRGASPRRGDPTVLTITDGSEPSVVLGRKRQVEAPRYGIHRSRRAPLRRRNFTTKNGERGGEPSADAVAAAQMIARADARNGARIRGNSWSGDRPVGSMTIEER
jgi:hypothetical protein